MVSHICPGPKRGYLKRSISDVCPALLPKNAALAAEKNERPLMRWAAHSARISEVETPHTFSV